MSKVTLSVELFNEIMDMAKKNTDPKSLRTNCTVVFIEVSNGTLQASSVHGSRAGYITVPWDEKAEAMKMIIPVMPKLKKQDQFCEITESDSDVMFKTARGATSMKREKLEWLDCTTFLPKNEPKETFYFDARNLVDALSVFDDTVKIEYRGATSPLIIERGGKKALVLPVNPVHHNSYHN